MNAREQKLAHLAREVELAADALASCSVEEYRAKTYRENAQRQLADRLRKLTTYVAEEPAKEEAKA